MAESSVRPVGCTHGVVGVLGNATVKLGTIPAGAVVFDTRVAVRTPFNGSGPGNFVTIGDAGDAARFFRSDERVPRRLWYEVPPGGCEVIATYLGSSTRGEATVAVLWLGSDVNARD